LPAERERHFLVRVRKNLKRRVLEVYPDGSALVEIRSGKTTRLVREILGRVQRGGRGPATTVRLWTSLLDWRRIAGMAIPKRRQRSCPRALRQPVSSWPRLRKNTYHKGPVQYAVGQIYA